MAWYTKLIPKAIKKAIVQDAINKTNELPPTDFFDKIKDKKRAVTTQDLFELKAYLNIEAQQFIETGQLSSAERLLFHINCIDREQEAILKGFNQFVYRDDLDDFISNVSQQVVKIIELENYERKIPDNKTEIIAAARPLFDQLYVVFTDYTGKETKKIEKKEQARDPIIFGCYKTQNNKVWNHRFYFICDWEDEFCDLTLDKFVSEMIDAGKMYHSINKAKPIDIKELEQRIKTERENIKNNVPSVNTSGALYVQLARDQDATD